MADYDVGEVEAVLRERRVGRSFTSFDERSDEYFGIGLIDSVERVRELRAWPRRTWIFADEKVRGYLGRGIKKALRNGFVLHLDIPTLKVFSNAKRGAVRQ